VRSRTLGGAHRGVGKLDERVEFSRYRLGRCPGFSARDDQVGRQLDTGVEHRRQRAVRFGVGDGGGRIREVEWSTQQRGLTTEPVERVGLQDRPQIGFYIPAVDDRLDRSLFFAGRAVPVTTEWVGRLGERRQSLADLVVYQEIVEWGVDLAVDHAVAVLAVGCELVGEFGVEAVVAAEILDDALAGNDDPVCSTASPVWWFVKLDEVVFTEWGAAVYQSASSEPFARCLAEQRLDVPGCWLSQRAVVVTTLESLGVLVIQDGSHRQHEHVEMSTREATDLGEHAEPKSLVGCLALLSDRLRLLAHRLACLGSHRERQLRWIGRLVAVGCRLGGVRLRVIDLVGLDDRLDPVEFRTEMLECRRVAHRGPSQSTDGLGHLPAESNKNPRPRVFIPVREQCIPRRYHGISVSTAVERTD